MMNVALCLTQHDPRLVALALLVCLVGVAASVQLFGCIRSAAGLSRFGWVMLAAVATGVIASILLANH